MAYTNTLIIYMFTDIINACNPAKKHSIKGNLLLTGFSWIMYRQEKKQHIFPPTYLKRRLMMAVEHLHYQTVDQRLEGIIELEKLAKAHPQSNWEIVEILTAFVRKNAPHNTQAEVTAMPSIKIHPDIQASLNFIGRRDTQQYLESEQIDLSYTDLRGINLNQMNLAGANLYQVNLSGANLTGANLAGAILSAANLSGANLTGANLAGAILSAANLSGANLTEANLISANFYLANLSQANLQDVIVDGANFREAKFSG